jgi:hypothetical protein
MPYTPPAGDAVELSFGSLYSPPAGDAVELNFAGDAGAFLACDVTLDDAVCAAVVGHNPPLAASVTLDDAALVAMLASHAPLVCTVTLDDAVCDGVISTASGIIFEAVTDDVICEAVLTWSSGVYRGIYHDTGINYGVQTALERSFKDGLRAVDALEKHVSTAWHATPQLAAERRAGWALIGTVGKHIQDGWDVAAPLSKETGTAFEAPPRVSMAVADGWDVADSVVHEAASSYIRPPRRGQCWTFVHGQAFASALCVGGGFGSATPVNRKAIIIPWELADPHSWIWGGWRYPPEPAPPLYVPDADLCFYQRAERYVGGAILEFNHPCWAWPISKTYTTVREGAIILIHEIVVLRLPDLTPVPVLSVGLDFDKDSWAWGVSLEFRTVEIMALLEPVDGEPRQVRIELDGIRFTALIEEFGESRVFGTVGYTARGRSTLALLAAPYAPTRSRTELNGRTAAQLIDYELDNTGWAAAYHASLLDLCVTDWLIPSGVWSYITQSPLDAVTTVAKAVGARAYADRDAQLIHITPSYPISPWDWATATPDQIIPLSLARTVQTQITTKPVYNQVYVAGQTQGVIANVKRTGSAGDLPAPMVSDRLITVVAAGREWGRSVLSDIGRQAVVTLEMPLTETVGLLEPGQLVEVSDAVPWRGLVVGVSLRASLGKISQQVRVERHYG